MLKYLNHLHMIINHHSMAYFHVTHASHQDNWKFLNGFRLFKMSIGYDYYSKTNFSFKNGVPESIYFSILHILLWYQYFNHCSTPNLILNCCLLLQKSLNFTFLRDESIDNGWSAPWKGNAKSNSYDEFIQFK